MKSSFFALLKVHFLGLLGINKIAKSKKGTKKLSAVYSLMLLIGALISFSVGYYINNFLQLFVGDERLLVINLITLSYVVFVIFYFIFSAKGNLFGSKDYDMLFSMPLSKKTIVGVKVFSLYLFAMLIAFLMYLPTYIVLLMHGFNFSVGFSIIYFLMIAVMPAIPLSVAIVLGSFTVILSARFKHKNIIEIVISLILLSLIV